MCVCVVALFPTFPGERRLVVFNNTTGLGEGRWCWSIIFDFDPIARYWWVISCSSGRGGGVSNETHPVKNIFIFVSISLCFLVEWIGISLPCIRFAENLPKLDNYTYIWQFAFPVPMACQKGGGKLPSIAVYKKKICKNYEYL